MNRLVLLSATLGVLMTGAAAAQSTVLPVNGTCPSGYELQRGTAGSDDQCLGVSGGSSGTLSLTSMSSGGDDDDYGSADHDSHESEHGDHDSDHD